MAAGRTAVSVAEGVTVLVPLDGIVDLEKERDRLSSELARVERDLGLIEKKLGNGDFVARAPAEVVATERARQTELAEKRTKLTAALAQL